MKQKNKFRVIKAGLVLILSLVLTTGCKKYLDIPLPVDKIAASGAFVSDASISGVLSGILFNLSSSDLLGSGNETIGYRSGLYADELKLISTNDPAGLAFYTNSLQSTSGRQWTTLYKQIYSCNLAIEGINKTTVLLNNRNQWLGEALFIRAWLYFYLVNLYGDVPLTVSSDYSVNNKLSRSPKALVIAQIFDDLKQAQNLLTTDYKDSFSAVSATRGRPNLYAVNALLARMYLYTGDWANAEAQSTLVISNTTTFSLVAPALTFLANSKETVFALAPTGTAGYVRDYGLYNAGIVTSATQASLSVNIGSVMTTSLVNAFEPNDARFTNWVRTVTTTTAPSTTFYLPNKYKSITNGTEYNIVLRLAEQYLIRSEARARQNNLGGAISDLNAIRTRAGLPGTAAATQADLLTAILKERQVELFTEYGHRFLDLKRTGTIDALMGVVTPQKGGVWNPQKQLWPIPFGDIQNDPNLVQTPGYN